MTTAKTAPEVDVILSAKRAALAERKQKTPLSAVRALASMQDRAQPFLCECSVSGSEPPMLIGHIHYALDEHATPYDPVTQAVRYVHAGVKAITLFTDTTPSSGSIDDLMFVARAVQAFAIPVISRDFIFDEYQIVEARAAGAAGLVLDPALLDAPSLRALLSATQRNLMTPIVRVGSDQDLETALALSPQVILLGAAPLCASPTNVVLFTRLRAQVPSHVNVMVSAERCPLDDVVQLARTEVDAIILGEHMLNGDLLRLRATLAL